MFKSVTPESCGIESARILEFLEYLEDSGLVTHGLLMAKDDEVFTEAYWKPFNEDFCHRMYSQTKSYVGIAIGLLVEEGKLSLDDKVYDYFKDELEVVPSEYMQAQTVREMLMMQTSAESIYWFDEEDPDRTSLYINHKKGLKYPPNTLWGYDSSGSQVLSSLVEKLSGKTLFDFLYERIFKELGTFKTATILKTRNGDSWGDSALVCTTRDMASFGRFVLNYGTWNGKRLMNEEYLRKASSCLVSNEQSAWKSSFTHGYGYQIWRTEQDGFAFLGMGDQIAIMHPATDTVFVITSDNQGFPAARGIIVDNYFDYIITPMQKEALAPDADAEKKLKAETADLKLKHETGLAYHENADKYNDKVVTCIEKGNMGISKFSLHFEGNRGELRYTNEQGDKVLPFGLCHNVFCKFPELGYANERGGVPTTDGFMYDCAVSASWRSDGKLVINCQIIDRYLGNFIAIIGFNGGEVAMGMGKTGEDLLGKYQGNVYGEITE